VENKSQDNIVLAVLNGSIDVGFVRTGQLEKMMQMETLESLDQVHVFQAIEDDFPLIHTTQLYPEWPIASLPSTNPQLVEEVRQILLEMPPDHPALKTADIASFVPAVDYTSIEELITLLKLKSWDIDPADPADPD
jgi:ABC-type phosphate/phosphonate transport system substrate-binding protein